MNGGEREEMSERRSTDECCSCSKGVSSVSQTLDELAFSRGIWSAAVDGDVTKTKSLLDQNISPNSPDTSGYYPLGQHYASRHGHYDVVQLLLERGATPNATTPSNTTPLHRAAYSCHSKVVTLLLQYGGDPSIKDNDGMTTLHKAYQGGSDDIISTIISKDPSLVTVTDNKGQLPHDFYTKQN